MSKNLSSTVGIVGVGRIGQIMAGHIIAAGHDLIAWDNRPEALERIVEAGGRAAGSLSEVAAADIVLTIVFDDAGVEETAFGRGGLAENLAPGSVHVVLSTISPNLARTLHEQHLARGQRFLAASMFGRPEAAQLAQTMFTCAGAREAYEDASAILGLLGTARWISPEPEHAMLVKIIGNNMIHAAVEELSEMFDFLSAAGISMREAKESIVDRLFSGLIYQGYAERIMEDGVQPRDYHPMRDKDSRLCIDAAQDLQVDLPLFRYLRGMHSKKPTPTEVSEKPQP